MRLHRFRNAPAYQDAGPPRVLRSGIRAGLALAAVQSADARVILA